LEDHQERGQKRVLSDHKRVGQRFIPPFVHRLGSLHEVKWIDVPLPELLWLGLLNHRHGLKRGAELAVEIGRAAADTVSPNKVWFGPNSAFGKLTLEGMSAVVAALKSRHSLDDFKIALGPLVALYPECPLAFLFEGNLPEGEKADHLHHLKAVLADLFDKTTKEATLMQANAIYIAFTTDKLKVFAGTSLANFPAVAEYPRTEDGRKVGSAVRATINMFFGKSEDFLSTWPRYFWNRGLEVDECMFRDERNDERPVERA